MGVSESSKVFYGIKIQTIITFAYGIIQMSYFSIMSRLLDKTDFGYYAILSAISFVLMEISNAGLGSAVIQKKIISREFVGTAFALSFLIGSFFMLLLMFFANSISIYQIGTGYLTIPLCIMAATMFFSTISSVPVALYMRNLEFQQYGYIQISVSLFSSFIGVVMAYLSFGVYSLVIAIFSNFLFLAILPIIFKRKELRLCVKKDEIKGILFFGGWLTASGVIRSIYNQMDRLITTRWVSVALLGTYTRASGFVINITSNVNSIFDTILFPILSGIQDDKEKLRHSFIKSSDLVFLLSFVFCFSMLLLAEPIIFVFLGEKWLSVTTIFKIVSISILFHPFCRICDSYFRSIGIVKEYFMVRVFICISSIILISYGSILASITGIAFAYVLSRILDAVVKLITINHNIGASFFNVLWSPFKNFIIVFILYLFARFISSNFAPYYSNIIGMLIFTVLLIVIVFIRPMIFGSTFNEYIYKKL